MADEIGHLTRCLIISMRIMSGDRVPVSVEQFLSEKIAKLYLRAILMRQVKNNPEEYDSILPIDEGEKIAETLSTLVVAKPWALKAPVCQLAAKVEVARTAALSQLL